EVLPGERRGDVVRVTARLGGGRAADRDGAAGPEPDARRGRGTAEGDGAGHRAGGPGHALRRGAVGRGGGAGAGRGNVGDTRRLALSRPTRFRRGGSRPLLTAAMRGGSDW